MMDVGDLESEERKAGHTLAEMARIIEEAGQVWICSRELCRRVQDLGLSRASRTRRGSATMSGCVDVVL